MKLHLVDTNAELVKEWEQAFAAFPEVIVSCYDLLAVAHTCVVSPANSYGFMDGGIDLEYYEYFGPRIQIKVQDAIAKRPEGLLPVGASLLVKTGDRKIPYLIVAPTMEMPGPVISSHCYHAMVAILRLASWYPETLTDIFCPGLATGTGRVSEVDAAEEMAAAYQDWQKRAKRNPEPKI